MNLDENTLMQKIRWHRMKLDAWEWKPWLCQLMQHLSSTTIHINHTTPHGNRTHTNFGLQQHLFPSITSTSPTHQHTTRRKKEEAKRE